MNQPYLFCLCVLCSLKNEFFLLTWCYLLIRGAVWGTQSLDVRCKFLKHILKALHTVPNSLRSENCYHWGKSFPCLNQSEQRIGGPWEVSKLYTSKKSLLIIIICWQTFLKSSSFTEIDAKIFTSSSPSFPLLVYRARTRLETHKNPWILRVLFQGLEIPWNSLLFILVLESPWILSKNIW